jgi:hypothetical protein
MVLGGGKAEPLSRDLGVNGVERAKTIPQKLFMHSEMRAAITNPLFRMNCVNRFGERAI